MKQFVSLAVMLAVGMSTGCQNKLFQRVPGTNMGIPFASGTDLADQQAMASRLDDRGFPAFDSTAGEGLRDAPISRLSTTFGSADDDLNRGHQEASRGRLDEAGEYYRRVLAKRPNDSTAHYRLAVIADQQLDYRAAERHYVAALRVNENDADVLSDLGYSYLLQKRFPESERMLARALQIRPNHVKTLNNLGLLYGRQGDRERALATFRQAGSESDAQQKMAVLFPQGGLTPSDFHGDSGPGSNTRLASNQVESNDFSVRPLPTEPMGGLSDTATDQTMRLQQMMKQARLESQRERMQRQQPEITTAGSRIGATAPRESMPPQPAAQFPRREQFGSRFPERIPDRFQAGGVVDHRINDAFSRLDSRSGSRNSSFPSRGQTTNILPFPRSHDRAIAPFPANDSPRGNATFTDRAIATDLPRDTSPGPQVMPGLWPTSDVSSRPIAPASFDERGASHSTTSPAVPATPSRRAATLAGWNAGPGMPFPVTQPDRATSRPAPAALPTMNRESRLAPIGRLPNELSRTSTPIATPPSDAIDVYQAEIDRRNREIGELNRLMQRERQLPAGGGAPRASFPPDFDAPRSAPGRFDPTTELNSFRSR